MFYPNKTGGNNNNKFGMLFRTTVVSMTINKIIQSASIIEFGNDGNEQNCIKVVYYPNKEGGNINNKIVNIFWTTVVFMATKSYNRLNY